jgi:hypothetical protein
MFCKLISKSVDSPLELVGDSSTVSSTALIAGVEHSYDGCRVEEGQEGGSGEVEGL